MEQELDRMKKALMLIKMFSPMRDEQDAYVVDVTNWGLGEAEKPNPEDYGLPKEWQ